MCGTCKDEVWPDSKDGRGNSACARKGQVEVCVVCVVVCGVVVCAVVCAKDAWRIRRRKCVMGQGNSTRAEFVARAGQVKVRVVCMWVVFGVCVVVRKRGVCKDLSNIFVGAGLAPPFA